MQSILLYGGSFLILLWGIAHLFPTRSVVAGFGPLSQDNRRILVMEWVGEGLALAFVGVVVGLTTANSGAAAAATHTVARAGAVFLLLTAAVSALTGARTSLLPLKLCPGIKTLVAIAYWAASFL